MTWVLHTAALCTIKQAHVFIVYIAAVWRLVHNFIYLHVVNTALKQAILVSFTPFKWWKWWWASLCSTQITKQIALKRSKYISDSIRSSVTRAINQSTIKNGKCSLKRISWIINDNHNKIYPMTTSTIIIIKKKKHIISLSNQLTYIDKIVLWKYRWLIFFSFFFLFYSNFLQRFFFLLLFHLNRHVTY